MKQRAGEDDSRRDDGRRGAGALPWRMPDEAPLRTMLPLARFRSIVVPLDGSPFAEHALPWAMSIARRAGARVQLVHVDVPLDVRSDPWNVFFNRESESWLKHKPQEYLHQVLQHVARRGNVPVSATRVEGGDVADGLSTLAGAGADLVVMATHGKGRWRRLFSGSISSQLQRRLSIPLLLVRGAQTPVDWTSTPEPRHILLPLEGSRFAEQILAPAIALGEPAGAEYTLLRVASSISPPVGVRRAKSPDDDRGDAGRYLRRVADCLGRWLPAVGTGSVCGTMPVVRAIGDYGKRRKVDVIAVTTGGRGRLARLWRASMAEKLIQQGRTPVLVYRPPQQVGKEKTPSNAIGA